MATKKQKKDDVVVIMTQIQEQLAVLNQKLDSFMTKSLTELAEALAASKPAAVRPVPPQPVTHTQPRVHPGRTMYSAVCFQCGDDCEIPFKPSGNRPVYCKKCFANRKSFTQKPTAPVTLTPSSFKPERKDPVRVAAAKPVAKKKPAAKKAAAKKKTTAKKKSAPKKKPVAKKKTAVKKKTAATKKKTVKKAAASKRKKTTKKKRK